MKYKASLDTLAKLTTSATMLLFIGLGYRSIQDFGLPPSGTGNIISLSLILLFLIGTLLGTYLYAPQAYFIDTTQLVIIRMAHNKTIKISDITEVHLIADDEMGVTMRTFGVGGLFGYYGRYVSTKMGRLTFYTTQRKNRIVIKTKDGKNIMITPDDLGFIETLRQKRIEQKP